MAEEWLSPPDAAVVMGISRQAVWKALRVGSWRGTPLGIRRIYGRGGRSGLSYQVSLSSLEAALEGDLGEPLEPIPDVAFRPTASNQSVRIGERLPLILTVLETPERTAERAAAVAHAAARHGCSTRTFERWVQQYQDHGTGGLGRKKPTDAGKTRVHVSRPFDRAFRKAGHDETDLEKLGRYMEGRIAGLWADKAEIAGWAQVQRLAEFLLLESCEARGYALPPSALRLSRRHIERFSDFRKVNVRNTDRKRFDDDKPRIRRDWTDVEPMARIIADVHPVDVYVSRPDGSLATPKLIGFMDAGTGRLFHHLVLLEPGEGVRQEHVIEAFLKMVSDPQWGLPRGLYLDNGSEFKHLEKLRPMLDMVSGKDSRSLIYAQPYNASAKPIENLFGRLERYVFSLLPGYVGGNRMKKRTHNVGRAPKPYPGSFEAFEAQVAKLIRGFNDKPVGGLWRNRSPQNWFAGKVAAGWRPTTVDPLVIDSVFSDREQRRVERGGVVKLAGRRWIHPALSALPARTLVSIAKPWRRGEAPLFLIPDGGWAYLSEEIALPAEWVEGARESRKRQKAHSRHVRQLAKAAPKVDSAAIAERLAERAYMVPLPKPDIAVSAGSQLAALASAKAAKPEPAPKPDDGLTPFQRQSLLLRQMESKVA